jgi:prepilin-type N-terminal cleavage/methylation domain-containing protein/prepilin-type processing-associated H-X9-DG protein
LERCRRGAFSLIELLVVMGIIAILVAIALPAVTRSRQAARSTQCANNLHNLSLAITMFEEANRRLPASGNYFDANGIGAAHHSWAVSILPWVDQRPLADRWDLDKPITDPVNQPLTKAYIPVYVCPSDISRSKKRDGGDLSYVVNGGIGFTTRTGAGVPDCPIHPDRSYLDLNGNGTTCPTDPTTDGDPSDRTYFTRLGLFFLENWKAGHTERHHHLADIKDGLSQTFLITENARTGYDPQNADSGFATPNPYLCAFYIGNPCPGGQCSAGNVDYSRCNAGEWRINSGVGSPEGSSPVPNSFHEGGVFMAFADGHVVFLSEDIDGSVYAALSSPQGLLLSGTPLQQVVVSGGTF